MKNRIFDIITVLTLILGLNFIQINVNRNFGSMGFSWTKNDLKLIDPIDSISQDNCDILAVFMRKNIYEFEIRVDFLNKNDIENCTLDTKFYKSKRSEINFGISTDFKNETNSGLNSVIFNKKYQYILLRFPVDYSKYNVQFTSHEKNSLLICDNTAQINLLQPSPDPFQINLMAFNTHPGFMPSQILRSWNGAHTGPNGRRHGLKFLLEAVETTRIPVTLLDLNTPSGLAAIEFLDVSEKIQVLQSSSLIYLPLNLNIDQQFSQIFIDSFRDNSVNLGYAYQNKVFFNLNQKFLVDFDVNKNMIDLTQEYNQDFLSDPKKNHDPFSINGLSDFTIKRIFNDNENSMNTTNILFPLNKSIIADQKYAKEVLLSIKNHPWLEVVNPFQNLPDSIETEVLPLFETRQTSTIFPNDLIDRILSSNGPFQNYLLNYANDINGRIGTDQFRQLSKQYLPNFYYYFAANQWVNNFDENATCDFDIDYDGMNECILSNRDFFGIIELDGGRLAFLVTHSENSVYQLIAPSSSIMFGLGPEQEWNLNNSQFADPQEIPGAFYDKELNLSSYKVLNVKEMSVSLTGNNETKKFSIEENGFKFEFTGHENLSLLIPIILAPDCMRTNQWPRDYNISRVDSDSKISINCFSETANIKIFDPVSVNIVSFIESQLFMLLPENPEISYSDGHYSKIGLTLLKMNYLEPNQKLTVTITR